MKKTPSELKNIYVFIGSETFLIEEEISAIRTRLGENMSMNSASYGGEDISSLDEIISLCNTWPFLSDKRLILIRNLHKISQKNMQPLYDYIDNPCESTILILTVEGQKPPAYIAKKVLPKTEVVHFEPLKGRVLTDWIQGRAKRYGKTIDKDAAFVLSDITGANTWFIASEIEKLSLYASSRPNITLGDVEALVMKTNESSIFTFMDALYDRKKDSIFRLHELELTGVQELEIISRIENQTILHYQILFGKGADKKGVHPFVAKKISSRKRLWTSDELIRLLDDVRCLEHRVKTGRSHHGFAAVTGIIGQFL